MASVTEFSSIFTSVFISLVLYYSFIKIVRTAILSTNRWINLDDLNILFLVSIFLTIITLQPISIIKYFIFIVLIIYWILLWIDGIIFYLYTFEINRQNIAEFFGDYRSMLHYSSRSVELFQRYPWIIILFPLSVVSIYTSFFRVDNAPILGFVIPIVISISIFIFQRFKQAIIRNIIALSIILIITYTVSENVLGLAKYNITIISQLLASLLFISIFVLNIFRNRSTHTFFSIASHFRKFLKDDKIKFDDSIALKEEHMSLVQNSKNGFNPSKYFGLLRDANVILITAESVGSTYLTNNLNMPFMTDLSKQSVISKNHFAISPHTNQFLIHLFNSNYTALNDHILYNNLIDSKYSASFISSANMNICESRELLEEIGYRNIIDRNNLYEIKKSEGDYLLLDAIPQIIKELKKPPCFIQLFTVQSHYPYDTIDKTRFEQNILSDLKTKYLNTIMETDFVLDNLFNELSKEISLDDTLIVYVGDHGESFGELGYKAHSNSTINAQLKVPFILKHRALMPEVIEFSTHFDIMPTILDLLGIEYEDRVMGSSIFCADRQLPALYYSMVRKGNAPANVKIKTGTEDIMIDRILDYCIVIDEADKIERHLSKDEERYFNTLMHKLLNKSNLIESK